MLQCLTNTLFDPFCAVNVTAGPNRLSSTVCSAQCKQITNICKFYKIPEKCVYSAIYMICLFLYAYIQIVNYSVNREKKERLILFFPR